MTTEPKATKLQETINEIEGALHTLKTDRTIKPKEYTDIAKIIERGEKKISKEYTKRMEQLLEINKELQTLKEFAEKMGYDLKEGA